MKYATALTLMAMAVVVLVLAAVAAAELCPKCKGLMYTADIGKCQECGGQTTSGAFKLCPACSKKLGQCEHCREALEAPKPIATAVSEAEPGTKVTLYPVGPVAKSAWPQFRGPTGMGLAAENNLPLEWGGADKKNVLWTSPLIGEGHASPIVWGNQVFVTTVSWPASVKDRGSVFPDQHVLCYQVSDGKLLWDTPIPHGPWKRNDFRSGPGGGYAAPTPCTDGRMVYAAYGSSVIAAVDMAGKLVWRKEIVPFTFDVTVASSPVLYGDSVFMFCAMAKPEDSKVIAFKKASGEVKWETKLPGVEYGHSTPVVIDVKGKPQLLVAASGSKVTSNALQALDPDTGKVLWWCKGCADIASPVYAGGLVYFDSGRGGPGTVVDPTGSGDVSATLVKRTVNLGVQAFGSPLVIDKYVYRLNNEGGLKCWELATGKDVYEQKLPGLGGYWGSPIADGAGRLIVATGGKSYVIQGGPEFKILGTSDLGDSNHPSPAVAGGRLFIVGMKNIYCIGNSK
jgi:outer membrane protein assembly factor BamB